MHASTASTTGMEGVASAARNNDGSVTLTHGSAVVTINPAQRARTQPPTSAVAHTLPFSPSRVRTSSEALQVAVPGQVRSWRSV